MTARGIGAKWGLIGRIGSFLETAHPALIVLAIGGLLLIVLLTILGRRVELFGLLVLACSMSGSVISALDSGSTILRWILIGLLAISAMSNRQRLGWPLILFFVYVITGIVMSVFSPSITWSIQWGGVLFGVALMGVTMTGALKDKVAISRMCAMIILVGFIWAFVGLSTLRELAKEGTGGERFTGATSSAGIFTQTGGILYLFALWGVVRPWAKWKRVLCAGLAVSMGIVLVSSAQRAGTFAAGIGTLALLAQKEFRQAVVALLFLAVVSFAIYNLASINERQTQFVIKRFTDSSSSNRTTIWADAMYYQMKSPILGHGFGANKALRGLIDHGTHNAYISVWYDTGIIGLAAFIGSMVYGGLLALYSALRAKDPELGMLARLVTAGFLYIGATNMVVSGASSPSDLSTCSLVCLLVASHQIWLDVKKQRNQGPAVAALAAPVGFQRVRVARVPSATAAYYQQGPARSR